VEDIDTIYTAVALSVWTWQAIQENIQNKLRAGLAVTAILPRRGTSKGFDFKKKTFFCDGKGPLHPLGSGQTRTA
jgi:hypothetical protein